MNDNRLSITYARYLTNKYMKDTHPNLVVQDIFSQSPLNLEREMEIDNWKMYVVSCRLPLAIPRWNIVQPFTTCICNQEFRALPDLDRELILFFSSIEKIRFEDIDYDKMAYYNIIKSLDQRYGADIDSLRDDILRVSYDRIFSKYVELASLPSKANMVEHIDIGLLRRSIEEELLTYIEADDITSAELLKEYANFFRRPKGFILETILKELQQDIDRHIETYQEWSSVIHAELLTRTAIEK